MNGTIDVAFGGKVDDGSGLMLCQQAGQQSAVTNIALHKGVARIALQAGQSFRVARVGEFVEVDDRLLRTSQPVENEIGADEAGAASNEDHIYFNSYVVRSEYRAK